MEILTLDKTGLLATAVMAVLFVIFGGGIWWFFILGMLLFLVPAALVTWLGREYKRKRKLGQEPRSVMNVLANGTVPLAMALLYGVSKLLERNGLAGLFVFMFMASVAAITADKFASEVGILDGMPVSLLTGRKVRKGVSGGVTWVGLTAAALAAGLVAVVLVPLAIAHGGLLIPEIGAIAAVLLCGFIGNIADSLLGHYEERGFGNKYTSNFACGAIGALAALLIALVA